MPVCGVILELDGVLIDSGAAHRQSWQEVGRLLGIPLTDSQIAAVFGRHNRDAVPVLFGDDRSADEVRRLVLSKEELYRAVIRDQAPITRGARALLEHYHDQGYQLALATGTPRPDIDPALEALAATELFEIILGSGDVAVGKPDPTMLLTAARELRLKPQDCLVVESSPAGIHAARAAGMPVIAVQGSFTEAQLCRADRIIRSLEDLIEAGTGQPRE